MQHRRIRVSFFFSCGMLTEQEDIKRRKRREKGGPITDSDILHFTDHKGDPVSGF